MAAVGNSVAVSLCWSAWAGTAAGPSEDVARSAVRPWLRNAALQGTQQHGDGDRELCCERNGLVVCCERAGVARVGQQRSSRFTRPRPQPRPWPTQPLVGPRVRLHQR
jgi:hypothetical protein